MNMDNQTINDSTLGVQNQTTDLHSCSRCEKLKKYVQYLEKCVLETKCNTRHPTVEVTNLEKKLKDSELLLLGARHDLRNAEHSKLEVLDKDEKLRKSFHVIVKEIQGLIFNNFSGNASHNTIALSGRATSLDMLAAMFVRVRNKMSEMETSRKNLQEEVRQNKSLVASMLDVLEQNSIRKSNNSEIVTTTENYNYRSMVNDARWYPSVKYPKLRIQKTSGASNKVSCKLCVKGRSYYQQLLDHSCKKHTRKFSQQQKKSSRCKTEKRETKKTQRNLNLKTVSVNSDVYQAEKPQALVKIHNDCGSTAYSKVQNTDSAPVSPLANQHRTDTTKKDGFYCLCGSHYRTAPALNFHIVYHRQNRKYDCHFCSQQFENWQQLLAHEKCVHKTTNLSQNHQPSVSMESIALNTLNQRNNYQEISTECKTPKDLGVVPVISSSLPSLTAFETSHFHKFEGTQAEDIYLCKCGMKFGNWDTLNAHMRYFAADQRFACSVCRNRYTSHVVTKTHMQRVHNIKVDHDHVACYFCGVIFASRTEYGMHLITRETKFRKGTGLICPMLQISSFKRKSEAQSKTLLTCLEPSQAARVSEMHTVNSGKPSSDIQFSNIRSTALHLGTNYDETSKSTLTDTTLVNTQPVPESTESCINSSLDSNTQILHDIKEFWSSLAQPNTHTHT